MHEFTGCPCCAGTRVQVFLHIPNVPVHQHLFFPTRNAATQCRRGDIVLGLCHRCGFVFNLAFDSSRLQYSALYDNTQSFSPTFLAYMSDLATHLVQRHRLFSKAIVEIGCGKGEFLRMLCQMGNNVGIGFDPSYADDPTAMPVRATFIKDFYSEKYADHAADFVCCRHVLEHVQYPAALVASVHPVVKGGPGVVFFEVPDVAWILDNLAFWDIFYEHCSYFSPGAIAQMCARCGFEMRSVERAFGGQYLWIEASPATTGVSTAGSLDDAAEIAQRVTYFAAHHGERLQRVRALFEEIGRQGRRYVVWGAGAKGVTLLNTLSIGPDLLPFVVDLNPRKQGMYIPGTGQQVVPPESLRDYRPDGVLVMNPNYLDEVRMIAAGMGISGEAVHALQ